MTGKEAMRVVEPGVRATVQDLGRFGYRRYGVPSSGAMDAVSYVWANKLIGNGSSAPAVEVLWGQFSAEVLAPTTVAVTGAKADVRIDGSRVVMSTPIEVAESSRLSIGLVEEGHVNYVSIRRGVEADVVLGSSSTYLKGGFGGRRGKPLVAGDVLCEGSSETGRPPPAEPPDLDFHREVFKTVGGPHLERISDDARERFFSEGFEISIESDRVGYKLKARQPLEFRGGYEDLVSFAVYPGMVQVPPDGNPVLLMSDCQTTGGYPVVGQVIQPDLGLLAQREPMQEVRFEEIGQVEALKSVRRFLDFVQD